MADLAVYSYVTLEFCCVIVFGMGWVLLLEPS